ncbi:hypothetical protein [Streptomyces sp. yr375]|uniref:hypothetical protein n=1 Tax=Streptomyces sp. yr375 TaxID=1761906 RepID=UPI0015A6DE20|nr:hypothetical protein [Streptomyces sp. yr375]
MRNPRTASPPRLLPLPAPAVRVPAAFDVHAQITATGIRITQHLARTRPPGHHLAA